MEANSLFFCLHDNGEEKSFTSRCHGSKISGKQQSGKRHLKSEFALFQTHRSYSVSFNLENLGEIVWG